jgi:hypothetical protein
MNLKLKTLLEGFAWERKPGQPLPTLKDVTKIHNEAPVDHTTMRLKSNIDQKWDTAQVIQKDLQSFIEASMGAGGEDLVNDIYMALKNSTEYARRVIRKG